MAMRFPTVIAVTLVAAAVASANVVYQANWQPNHYRVKCTHGSCMPSSFHTAVEGYLHEVSKTYQVQSWLTAPNFGPVQRVGSRDYIEVHDTERASYASTIRHCGANTTSSIFFGTKVSEIAAYPHMVHFFFGHELFHIIQMGYRAFNVQRPDNAGCDWTGAGWVTEGTATDVALELSRQKFASTFSMFPAAGAPGSINDRMNRILSGARRYDLPLNHQREEETGIPIHYQTQSFWRHVSEIYFKSSRTYLQKFFEHRPRKHDWLEWLQSNLKNYVDGLSLGPVFTLFLADYAGWGAADRPGKVFREPTWLREIAFGGCTKVSLSPAHPAEVFDLGLLRTSGACIELSIDGLADGQRVALKAVAITPEMTQTDQINLGLVETTGKQRFHCATALRTGNEDDKLDALFRCLFLGNNGYIKLNGKEVWARVWDVFAQYPERGVVRNTYVVTRVATRPTDFPAKNDGGDRMSFKFAFVADFSVTTIAGRRREVRTVAHLNLEPVHNAQEQVPKFNKRGGPAVPLLYPHAPVDLVLPPIPIHPDVQGNRKGIWMMRVTDVTSKDEGLFNESLTEGDSLAVYPHESDGKTLRPLQIGDQGSFAAHIAGTLGGRGVRTLAPAALKVTTFSPYVLDAEVTGTLCEGTYDQRDQKRCINPLAVSLRIVKGLAGWHHPDTKYVAWDSVSTRQLRAHVKRIMDTYTGVAGPSDSGGGGGGGGGPGGPGNNPSGVASGARTFQVTGPYSSEVHKVGKCECTCNDIHYLESLGRTAESGTEQEKRAVLGKIMAMGACMRPCTPHYINTCKNEKKKP